MAKKTDPEAPAASPSKSRLGALLASDLIGKLKKKHGETALLRASDFNVQHVPRVPTGIFDLDYALGGGFPLGRISIVYGPKSAAKTTLFLKTIANAQKMCSNCNTMLEEGKCKCGSYRETVVAYIDVEGALDLTWAQRLGVDTEAMLLSVPEYAEQALDLGEALLRSGEVDVLVIDSIAFLSPQKEVEESVEKETMGQQSRLVGKGVRKFVAALNGVGKETGRRPTVLFTNQIRFKLGMLFGNPETQPGGQAPGFASSVEVRVSPLKYEHDEMTKKPMWADFRFKVEKNKTFGAKMEGEYKLILADTETKQVGETADEGAMVEWGEKFGVITRDGGYNCLGRKFRIKAELEKALETDKVLKKELRECLLPILIAA